LIGDVLKQKGPVARAYENEKARKRAFFITAASRWIKEA
jgi:hypothetical protein